MPDDQDKKEGEKKEDKFDSFTPEGEALGYISLDQARVLAIEHARDNREFYGSRYARRELVWEVVSAEEGEDYYDIRLSYRPARRFVGDPGIELFTIEKAGAIALRQVLSEPQPRRRRGGGCFSAGHGARMKSKAGDRKALVLHATLETDQPAGSSCQCGPHPISFHACFRICIGQFDEAES